MSSRVGSTAVVLVFVLPWLAITGFADYMVGSSVGRQVQSASWPTAQGTITSSEVETARGNKSITYGLKVAYTYSVDGQQREGHKYRITTSRSGDIEEAQALVDRYPVGARVTVYHSPGPPSEAILQPGLGGGELVVLLMLLPFNLVALYLVRMVVQSFKPKPPLLSPFTREDGSECVAPDAPDTGTWVGLVMGPASLACVVLTSSLAGVYPPVLAGVAAWAVVIASGLFVGRYIHTRKKAGHYEVRLHRRERRLSLPPIQGRKARLEVRWRDVLSLRVEPQVPAKKDTHYRATLEIATADGTTRQEAVCEFTREEQAAALAQWLRQDLRVGEVSPEALRSA
ncbi:DUF3592 domain-containing protein [Myxococcus sp. K38C18041901]|uniref:DUF3592 domain-containing protein n=1 Tax=Myxococcus guangdongensis TaxID=2906760 RepID=UPI0020A6F93A|nr:DUF3592 domain-containing protein [Myxococcus guangdongensis]MCP3061157.1 DUF3592 domain-containing protein [Myxococcus guangdongensis]